MMKSIVLIVILLFIAVSLISAKTIASATLTITLTVPAEPITKETDDGDYGSYIVAKNENRIEIISQ